MRFFNQFRLLIAASAFIFLCGLNGCGGSTTQTVANPAVPTPVTPASLWAVAWGAPPEDAFKSATNPGGAEQSYRFILLPTVTGQQERLHFSNFFSTGPITIGSARLSVAVSHGPAIDSTRDQPILFNGSPTITLAPGQETVSDPVKVTYSFGERLAVSMYLKGSFGQLTHHNSQVTPTFTAGPNSGDTTADATGAAFTQTITEWFSLTGVDVYGPYQGTVAYFGSSSVDGHNSDYSSANAYPVPNVAVPGQDDQRPSDWLAKQMIAAGFNMGVLNAGTIANPAVKTAGHPPPAISLQLTVFNVTLRSRQM